MDIATEQQERQTRQLHVDLPADLHRSSRIAALSKGETLKDRVQRLLVAELEREPKRSQNG